MASTEDKDNKEQVYDSIPEHPDYGDDEPEIGPVPAGVHQTRAANLAPAINMNFNDNSDGDIIMHDVMVPKGWSKLHTYYCTLNWGTNDSGGYCGIQDSTHGHNSIMSIWDPKHTSQQLKAFYLGHGSRSLRFGGEGTGLQTNCPGYGWHDTRWYTTVVRAWNYGAGHTHFGLWIHDQSAGRWFHHATIDYPEGDIVFKGPTNCFIENYSTTNPQLARSVYYKDGYKRTKSGQWIPWTTGHYNVHGGTVHANNYDVRLVGTKFWLATGGTLKPTVSSKDDRMTIGAGQMSPTPTKPPINFSVTSASHTHASWSVPANSTPQFFYEVKIDGKTVSYNWSTEVHSVNFNHPAGHTLEVTIEDILGHRVSHSTSI